MDYLEKHLKEIEQKIQSTKKLLQDPEMVDLAKQEIEELEKQKVFLQGDDSHTIANQTSKSIIMEIRAAAGGNEAGLFANDLYRMYVRFAEKNKWKYEQLSINEGGMGNIKEVVFRIQGSQVYEKLKNESGVHRVQRVPLTESSGRIHTSTVTVAVLLEVGDRQFHIEPKDLKIETYRASGHGGQNVQKVETAVRITHLPTNTVATCQSERSQFQNKERAMQILRSRLFESQRQAEKEGVDLRRKLQVGTGQRSEKIRTYNFPQSRITDHRIKKSWHDLESIMGGNLNKVVDDLNANL